MLKAELKKVELSDTEFPYLREAELKAVKRQEAKVHFSGESM